MYVQTNDYTDFVAVANSFKEKPTVFAYSSPSLFHVYAVVGPTLVVQPLATEPSSFATDFPTAISLAADFTSFGG